MGVGDHSRGPTWEALQRSKVPIVGSRVVCRVFGCNCTEVVVDRHSVRIVASPITPLGDGCIGCVLRSASKCKQSLPELVEMVEHVAGQASIGLHEFLDDSDGVAFIPTQSQRGIDCSHPRALSVSDAILPSAR